ncbi:two-component system, response regulator YesN [Paenibacillus sp. 1_12]|uniref:response regulator n=1 Tax=Paenibacillus sp. 1_12 TaxID=1566278 RepID=UPI0008E9632D|nr:response regulator [Paenibacillus sp. 1_12]SFK94671.1 two-component system, response regulator YesN [Paenibacillus sp. 1_12]
MIRVLVVDDDKLVRKGLISAMPWHEFDMQVVGEANNGERALEFLQSNPVDLLLTDLAMPVMSGIELMRLVRQQFPSIHIVVLTLHQDFEYVQEALRLGAIDYIAKIQLEKERFEEVLERIYKRIMQVGLLSDGNKSTTNQDQEGFNSDRAYVWLALNKGNGNEGLKPWGELKALETQEQAWIEVELNLWLWNPAMTEASVTNLHLNQLLGSLVGKPNWMLLGLDGLMGRKQLEVYRWLREYREKEFFYDYNPVPPATVYLTMDSISVQQPVQPEENLTLLKGQWSSHEWIYNDHLFSRLVRELKLLRLPQVKLIGLLYGVTDEWNRLFVPLSLLKIELAPSFDSWHEVEAWFTEVRAMIHKALAKPAFSPEVIECVMKAIQMLHQELNQQVTAADISRRVNMSRSYFSQCFKEIAGKTFNDYLRQVRVEKAKEYLLYTNKTIAWIAENTGYMDEKYFSRSFREQIGLLPSEFRVSSREGREMSDK